MCSCLPQPAGLGLGRGRPRLDCLAERLRARPQAPRCTLRALVLFEQQRAGLPLANLAAQMCSQVLCPRLAGRASQRKHVTLGKNIENKRTKPIVLSKSQVVDRQVAVMQQVID